MEALSARQDRPQLERLADGEVVAQVRAGDAGLFELIMRRYNQRMFRVARGILGDDAEAEDAVQDAYVDAYLKLGQFRGPEGFASWLCRIGANHALMRRRRRRPLVSVDALERDGHEVSAMSSTTPGSSDPEAESQDRQLRARLQSAIDALPEVYREAFVLREVECMSVEETAAVLDSNAATIKTRTFRARRLLRQRLAAELGDVLPDLFSFAGERCDRLVARVFRRLQVGDDVTDQPEEDE